MSVTAPPSTPLQLLAEDFATGLVGTLGFTLFASDGSVLQTRTTAGITEFAGGVGIYSKTIVTPATEGVYFASWDDGAGIRVTEDVTITLEPVTPTPVTPGAPSSGAPCVAWVSGADVAALPCSTATADQLAPYADAASELLYALVGRRFPGVCTATARPCVDDCACWSRFLDLPGDAWHWGGAAWELGAPLGLVFPAGYSCGCGALSQVKLAGYPVQSITAIKIDGVVVDPATYRLDDKRRVTRLADAATGEAVLWPSCQRLDKPDTDPGTFSVTYSWGEAPPAMGVIAALSLACELWKARHDPGKCRLSDNIVRVVRQGVTLERGALPGFANGRTGLRDVDAFLGTYNPQMRRRRSAIWSPDTQPFARRIG